jgi:hypothetical protein
MVSTCPKCARNIPEDSVYCPYCGYGVKPSAKKTQVSAGGSLLIVAAVASLIFFILSIRALAQIYTWYPPAVAQGWIFYDQMLTVFSLTGFLFGFSAALLSFARRSYTLTMTLAVLCMLSGAGTWIISMIIPFANMVYAFLYYFLPMFAIPLIGTLLIYPRKAEFNKKVK